VIDPVSIPFLKGSEIAFVDELAGAQFVVRNPNASSSCGWRFVGRADRRLLLDRHRRS